MKLGIITSIWWAAGLPLGESLRRAARAGVRYVDVFARNQGDPTFLSAAEREEAARIAHGEGLVISGLVSLFGANSADPDPKLQARNWDYMRLCMDFAEQLEARQLLYLPGDRERWLPMAQAWESSVAFARRCAQEAEARGLVLALELEPHVYSVARDLPTALQYIKEVDSPAFAFNADTGHIHCIRAGAAELAELLPYTVHVHLSDNRGLIDSHDILGYGTCPNVEYMQQLIPGADAACKARGLGEAVATIEINFGTVPPMVRHDPDEALRMALAWCREHLPELSLT